MIGLNSKIRIPPQNKLSEHIERAGLDPSYRISSITPRLASTVLKVVGADF
jgi:hypothetical protein